MKLATGLLKLMIGMALFASVANAAPYREEHVTGGVLDLLWVNGFDTSNNMQGLMLDASDPAYANPSGDHTVAVATNSIPDSGGIILTSIDTQGISDYQWEAWMFTGDGSTRRGLIVRGSPAENIKNYYMFVLESGLVRLRFRKFIDNAPNPPTAVTLQEWFTNTLPGGVPALNTWHHMKVVATQNQLRCWWDGQELTSGPGIVDGDLATGSVGCYNFRFDLGGVPVYFDDLLLSDLSATPVTHKTWAAVKKLYR